MWRLGCVRDCVKLLGGGVTASLAVQLHCSSIAAALLLLSRGSCVEAVLGQREDGVGIPSTSTIRM